MSSREENLRILQQTLPRKGSGDTDAQRRLRSKVVGELHDHAKGSVVGAAFEAPWGSPAVHSLDDQQLDREHQVLTKLIRDEKRELGRQDFWYFLTEVLFPTSWEQNYTSDFHRALCHEVQSLPRGKDLWFFIPREHRKSFILTIAHTLWLIVKDPNIRVLLVGAREDTVRWFSRQIISAFHEDSPHFTNFRDVFPDFTIKGRLARASLNFVHPLRTKNVPDPTFRATYVGVAGASWRCDVLKFDDAVERRNVTSVDLSFKTLAQMMDLFPLLETNSPYRNIMGAATRWAYHDPYGRVIGEDIEGEGEDAFSEVMERLSEVPRARIIVRHALEDPTRSCEHCPKHVVEASPHGHPSMDGEAIASPVITKDDILDRFNKYCIDPNKGESLFWHQYMNVCLAPANQKFKPEWFLDLGQPGWPVSKRRVIAIDSADKDLQSEGRGDFMVAWMAEYDEYGRIVMRYGLRSNRWTREEFIRRIETWFVATGWWPQIVAKEKFGNDTFLTDFGRMLLRNYHPAALVTVSRPRVGNTRLSKNDWIVASLQAPLERAEIVFGSLVPRELRSRAEYELCNLGQVTHDDTADAMAILTDPSVRLPAVPRDRPAPRNEWTTPDMTPYSAPDGRRSPSPIPQYSAVAQLAESGGSMRIHSPDTQWSTDGVTWDPPPVAEQLEIGFAPDIGTGRRK